MKHWYVVHTLPKGEELALQHLMAQGFSAFLPRYHRVRRHARKTEVVVAPLFPRYLFVELDLYQDRWLSIDSTRGVAYLLRQNGCPQALPLAVIETLKQQADVHEVVPLASLSLFEPGTRVEVLDGAFIGHFAIYEKMADKDRVQLLLNMLGRELRVALPANTVVAA